MKNILIGLFLVFLFSCEPFVPPLRLSAVRLQCAMEFKLTEQQRDEVCHLFNYDSKCALSYDQVEFYVDAINNKCVVDRLEKETQND